MQHTIESFVRTLQEDGIAAGKEAAKQTLIEANQVAAKIIADAHVEAEQILHDTHTQQQADKIRQEQDLQLAARDAVLELQHRLCQAVEAIIDDHAATLLGNNHYLATFIDRVVTAFATTQAHHPEEAMVFKVAKEDSQHVVQAAIAELTQHPTHTDKRVFQVETGLADLGFEYRQNGNAVEVTPQTVVALLAPLVSEEVRNRIDAAMKKNELSSECQGGHSKMNSK